MSVSPGNSAAKRRRGPTCLAQATAWPGIAASERRRRATARQNQARLPATRPRGGSERDVHLMPGRRTQPALNLLRQGRSISRIAYSGITTSLNFQPLSLNRVSPRRCFPGDAAAAAQRSAEAGRRLPFPSAFPDPFGSAGALARVHVRQESFHELGVDAPGDKLRRPS